VNQKLIVHLLRLNNVGALFRYKIHYITNMAFNIYKDYFLTGNTLKKIKLIDIVKFKDIEKRFVLNGLNHRAKNITYNFHKNYVPFELVQVP